MTRTTSWARTFGTVLVSGAAAVTAGYAAYAAVAWCRYGHAPGPTADERDELLDQFMPTYDVVERHRIAVNAPAAVTLAAAGDQDVLRMRGIRSIFKMRAAVMRASGEATPLPRGLLAATRALGWGTLADVPGREVVMGAVTRPWEANVRFRAVPAHEFASFSEPGFVKIVWTLRALPLDETSSMFLTETRVTATSAGARARFRCYWAFASPGIGLIRQLSLCPLKREAERRWQQRT